MQSDLSKSSSPSFAGAISSAKPESSTEKPEKTQQEQKRETATSSKSFAGRLPTDVAAKPQFQLRADAPEFIPGKPFHGSVSPQAPMSSHLPKSKPAIDFSQEEFPSLPKSRTGGFELSPAPKKWALGQTYAKQLTVAEPSDPQTAIPKQKQPASPQARKKVAQNVFHREKKPFLVHTAMY